MLFSQGCPAVRCLTFASKPGAKWGMLADVRVQADEEIYIAIATEPGLQDSQNLVWVCESWSSGALAKPFGSSVSS